MKTPEDQSQDKVVKEEEEKKKKNLDLVEGDTFDLTESLVHIMFTVERVPRGIGCLGLHVGIRDPSRFRTVSIKGRRRRGES